MNKKYNQTKNDIKTHQWLFNLFGLSFNLIGAILIFYSLGIHPCADSSTACGGTTGGLHVVYMRSQTASFFGLLFLMIGFLFPIRSAYIF